jgi:NAD(P)-dependent dehydrogenase (short-subunit alcohol dehydrogenase family)
MSPVLDKIVLVTGANSGIGKETALALAQKGARLVLACRDPASGAQARDEIRRTTGNENVSLVHVELGDLRSVERCAQEVIESTPRLDVLINNAGGTSPRREVTAQGLEKTFAVNYLGHYALTRLLLKHLQKATAPRILNVSSGAHRYARGLRWDDLGLERSWGQLAAYAQSKLAQVLFTRELARRYGEVGVFSHAVRPGLVRTAFYRQKGFPPPLERLVGVYVKLLGMPPARGAATSIFLASSPEALRSNGLFWLKCKPQRPSRAATDDEAARRLWLLSEQLVEKSGIALA